MEEKWKRKTEGSVKGRGVLLCCFLACLSLA